MGLRKGQLSLSIAEKDRTVSVPGPDPGAGGAGDECCRMWSDGE